MINKNFKYIKIFILIIICLISANIINNKSVAQTDGSISVSLIENGEETEKLLSKITGNIKYNYAYDEEIKAKNTGTAKCFIKCTINDYWVDEEGEKDQDATDYGGVELNLVNSDSWIIDEYEYTEEQIVLYYNEAITPGNETKPLSDIITFFTDINIKTIGRNYDNEDKFELISLYGEKSFVLDVTFEAIEAENAQAAAQEKGWSSNITFDGDELSFNY